MSALPVEQSSVTQLKGIGPALAEKLHALGVHTVLDLLFHLPLRYQDRTKITAIGGLRQGADVVITVLHSGRHVHTGTVSETRSSPEVAAAYAGVAP